MKKYILILVTAILPLAGYSQSIFDKFEDYEDVTSVVVSEGMFRLLSKINPDVDDPEAQDFIDIAKTIKNLKVFTTEDEKIGREMKATVDKYLGSKKLMELMRVKDKDANVKIYIKEGKDADHVSELLMFVSDLTNAKMNERDIETVLVSITGDIDLNKVGALTKKMNLPEEMENINDR